MEINTALLNTAFFKYMDYFGPSQFKGIAPESLCIAGICSSVESADFGRRKVSREVRGEKGFL